LNQLVGDLLHYARPLAPEAQLIGVRELVERALSHLRARTDLEIEIIESAPVGRIGGDPMLLRQAVDNVVNNAVQAMPSGGTLTIILDRVEDGPKARVSLTISDTGEGMDTIVRKRALDPFFTTRPAGTGLGLAIVARVVDAHGGELTLRSAPGEGTEVAMILPVDPAPPRAQRGRLSLMNVTGIRDSASGGLEAVASEEEVEAESASSGVVPKAAGRD
jgi:signal transduction histidine kinase